MNHTAYKRVILSALVAALVLMGSAVSVYAAKDSGDSRASAGSKAASKAAGEAAFELFQNEYRLDSFDPDRIYMEEAPYFPYWIVARNGMIARAWSNDSRVLYTELVEEEDDWDYVRLIPVSAGDAVVTVLSAEGERIEVPVHVEQKFVDEFYYMPVFRYAAYVAPVYEGENYICGSIMKDTFEDDDLWEMPDLSSMTITATYDGTEYTGTEPDQDGFYTFIGTPVMEWGKEYTVHFRKGEAEYSVTRTVSRPIEQLKIRVGSAEFTGSEVRPKVVIRDGDTILKEGSDYSFEVSDNVHVGRGKITLYGADKYSGDKTMSFQILPARTALTDLDREPQGFTAEWEPLVPKEADKAESQAGTAGNDGTIDTVDGYMIQYSTTEDFSSGNRSVSVNGADRASVKVSGLEARTVYYVRVRSFKVDGDQRYFSVWSEPVKVKTK